MNPFKKETKQLSIFTTAGHPKINSLKEQIASFEQHSIDFIEVGIPFSDPMADGPVIQRTSEIALHNGMNLDILFSQLQEISTKIPIVLMGYFNPVLSFGLERFLLRCTQLNIKAVILPDLSLEIYERFYKSIFESFEVYPVFMITPQTATDRIQRIASACSNSFVYLVSSNATTGTRLESSNNQDEVYRKIKHLCGETPLFIGFGIKTKIDVQRIQESVDGAIIGSAYLESVAKGKGSKFLTQIK